MIILSYLYNPWEHSKFIKRINLQNLILRVWIISEVIKEINMNIKSGDGHLKQENKLLVKNQPIVYK